MKILVKDPFKTLGLTSNASPEEVRMAFRRAAMKYHPDRTGQDPQAQQVFEDIRLAYEEVRKIQKKPGQRVVFPDFSTTRDSAQASLRPAAAKSIPAAPPSATAPAVEPETAKAAPFAETAGGGNTAAQESADTGAEKTSTSPEEMRDLSPFSRNFAAGRAVAVYEAIERSSDNPTSSVIFIV